MNPRYWLRHVMAVLAVTAAAFAAHSAPVAPAVPADPPKTGHHHVPGGEVLRWCLADGLGTFMACEAMCRRGDVDVVVLEGSRFGIPTFNPVRCADLIRKENI